MKTPSDLDWISNAQTLVSDSGKIIRCTLQIDSVEDLSTVTHPRTYRALVEFCRAVNCSEYRCQILHHACVLQLSRVLYVVATKNGIPYVADIFIPNGVIQPYKALIQNIRLTRASWSTRDLSQYPKFMGDQLGFASTNEDIKATCKIAIDLASWKRKQWTYAGVTTFAQF